MTTVHQTLTQARALIADPEHWTRDTFARTKLGTPTDPRGSYACSFCALGALKAASIEDADAYVRASDALYTASGRHSVVQINDDQGHEAVLALYDRAIEASIP